MSRPVYVKHLPFVDGERSRVVLYSGGEIKKEIRQPDRTWSMVEENKLVNYLASDTNYEILNISLVDDSKTTLENFGALKCFASVVDKETKQTKIVDFSIDEEIFDHIRIPDEFAFIDFEITGSKYDKVSDFYYDTERNETIYVGSQNGNSFIAKQNADGDYEIIERSFENKGYFTEYKSITRVEEGYIVVGLLETHNQQDLLLAKYDLDFNRQGETIYETNFERVSGSRIDHFIQDLKIVGTGEKQLDISIDYTRLIDKEKDQRLFHKLDTIGLSDKESRIYYQKQHLSFDLEKDVLIDRRNYRPVQEVDIEYLEKSVDRVDDTNWVDYVKGLDPNHKVLWRTNPDDIALLLKHGIIKESDIVDLIQKKDHFMESDISKQRLLKGRIVYGNSMSEYFIESGMVVNLDYDRTLAMRENKDTNIHLSFEEKDRLIKGVSCYLIERTEVPERFDVVVTRHGEGLVEFLEEAGLLADDYTVLDHVDEGNVDAIKEKNIVGNLPIELRSKTASFTGIKFNQNFDPKVDHNRNLTKKECYEKIDYLFHTKVTKLEKNSDIIEAVKERIEKDYRLDRYETVNTQFK